MVDVGPDALPQHLDRALRAVFRQHAGTAELEEAQPGMARHQRVELEFVAGVEAAGDRRALLPEQTIGADDLVGLRARNCGVEHQQMVASLVETVGIALFQRMQQLALGAELLIKYPEPHRLRSSNLVGVARQTDFQRSNPAERAARRYSSAFPA